MQPERVFVCKWRSFDQPDTGKLLEREPRIVRPANFEEQKPGRGWGVFEVAGVRVGVANLLGQLFMRPKVTSPFEADVRSGQALDIHAVVRDYHEPPGA